eukprot:scaffold6458_cov107-Skeletonema_dohrnii-CCMP3373.AAC.4
MVHMRFEKKEERRMESGKTKREEDSMGQFLSCVLLPAWGSRPSCLSRAQCPTPNLLSKEMHA